MDGGGNPAELVGRTAELRWFAALIEQLRHGAGAVVELTGEPGSGKTALQQAALLAAPDVRQVRCRGVEWEAELPFSGLHELLAPLLDRVPQLPPPQRRALAGALGLEDVGEIHPLNVHAGALSLLVDAAQNGPLAVVADDLQWIDSATLQALGFIGRRVQDEPILVIAVGRPGAALPGRSAEHLGLGPLARQEVAALASRLLGRPLPDAAAQHLTRACAGNPLAIIESVRSGGEGLLRAGSLLDAPLPVGDLIERSFAARVAQANPATRAALELVSTALITQAGALRAALSGAGLGDGELFDAERLGLLTLDGATIDFTHPLLRSVVHAQMSPARRRECHAAITDVTDDDDLRAWHAACAAIAPDDQIAAALDRAARAFVDRGGHAAAARAFARAAELTADGDGRAARYLDASNAARHAANIPWARALHAQAEHAAHSPAAKVRLEFEGIVLEGWGDPGPQVAERYLEVARRSAGLDESIVIDSLTSAALEGLMTGQADVSDRALQALEQLQLPDDLEFLVREDVPAVAAVVRVRRLLLARRRRLRLPPAKLRACAHAARVGSPPAPCAAPHRCPRAVARSA